MGTPWVAALKLHWHVISGIAEAHAELALPEAKVGLLPCAGGTQNLTWLVGEGWGEADDPVR